MAESPQQSLEDAHVNLLRGIAMPKITFLNETEYAYTVAFDGAEYTIGKSDVCEFVVPHNTPLGSSTPSLQLQNAGCIFIDQATPKEFHELLILHELREMEYKIAGFTDAHQRAIHDELLYILQYFDTKKREQYLEFAKAYRAKISGEKTVAKKAVLTAETIRKHSRLSTEDTELQVAIHSRLEAEGFMYQYDTVGYRIAAFKAAIIDILRPNYLYRFHGGATLPEDEEKVWFQLRLDLRSFGEEIRQQLAGIAGDHVLRKSWQSIDFPESQLDQYIGLYRKMYEEYECRKRGASGDTTTRP